MSYKTFMNKVRYLDGLAARWMMRHFYFLFFQILLAAVLLFWLMNITNLIDAGFQIPTDSVTEKLLMSQSINTSIIVLLIILNSFWLLYIFNIIQRMTNILRDINYQLTRNQNKGKNIN